MFTGLLRTIILYILIIAGVRLMGKRQVGELEPSELVLSLIIADLASVPMQDYGIPLLTGVVPILTLLSVTMILSVLTMKSVRFRALLSAAGASVDAKLSIMKEFIGKLLPAGAAENTFPNPGTGTVVKNRLVDAVGNCRIGAGGHKGSGQDIITVNHKSGLWQL